MFDLRRAKLQRLRATKPSRSLRTMFSNLGLGELIDPTTEAELGTAFNEVFDQFSWLNHPDNGGEKVFAFDALRLLEGLNNTWKELYEALADSREELLRENGILIAARDNPKEETDSRLLKAQGELAFKKNQFQQLQEQYTQRGGKIMELEAQLASLKKESPKNVPTFTVSKLIRLADVTRQSECVQPTSQSTAPWD